MKIKREDIIKIEELMQQGKQYEEIAETIDDLVGEDFKDKLTYGDLMEAVISVIDWKNYDAKIAIRDITEENAKKMSIVSRQLSDAISELQDFYKATAQKFIYGEMKLF